MNAETAYVFRHALLRDAAYQLQLPGDRTRLHALAFAVLEALFGGPPPDLPQDPDGISPGHPVDAVADELAAHARRGWREGASMLRALGDTAELARATEAMTQACAKAGVPPFDA